MDITKEATEIAYP